MRKSILMVRLLFLLALALLLYGKANATPVIAPGSARAFMINTGYNGFVDPGYYLILRASITPSGPGTTAIAQQDSTSYPLPFSPQPFPPQANRYQSTTPYAGQTGQWNITATDAEGSASAITNPLDDPQYLPLATHFSVSGPVLTPTLTWDSFEGEGYSSFFHPSYPDERPPLGYDYYMLSVTIRLAQPGIPLLYSSSSFYTNVTSYTIDPNVFALSANEEYLFGLVLSQSDLHSDVPRIFYTESMSETFLAYSTKPVPEPATMLLLASGLVGLAGFKRRFKK